jgi:tRNA pseudouridine55 synthase
METATPGLDGVLVVDKPQGPTSFDVVREVRHALKTRKVGHTGTLDPMATGVLAICLGDATRIAQYLTDGDKAYEAVIRLGAETDTLDAQGKVTAECGLPVLNREIIEAALRPFRGGIWQTPPMYSAIKMGGKRLYELARAGEEVERKAREITVYALELRDFSSNEIRVFVKASKGFFVRSLAQDLGRALGSGAHLSALRRVASGPFVLAQAVTLAEVVAKGPAIASQLVSAEASLEWVPSVTVPGASVEQVMHGVQVETSVADGLVRVLGPRGELLAMADAERGRLKYRRVLAKRTDEA